MNDREKEAPWPPSTPDDGSPFLGKKEASREKVVETTIEIDPTTEKDLNATNEDLDHVRVLAREMSVEDLFQILQSVLKLHENDQNFPHGVMMKIRQFLENNDVRDHPEAHEMLINEMKLEAALITSDSPYPEVRAVVGNTDDTQLPSLTFRVWVIGILFTAILAAVRQFFSIRYPKIAIHSSIVQILAYPVGKAMEKSLPDVGFSFKGVRHSLNPGPFNKKEHMLITIFAGMFINDPYTLSLVFIQYLPQWFNQAWSANLGYQFTIAFSTQFLGFGLAGLVRKFLVHPVHCVWPTQLPIIALNNAFHEDDSAPLKGPWNKTYSIPRLRFFLYVMGITFLYFWLPNYLFTALSTFGWIEWIWPKNTIASSVFGVNYGLGVNPLPTFDYNIVSSLLDPLVYPYFATANIVFGVAMAIPFIVILWVTNTFDCAYLPVLSTRPWDHFGQEYNVSRVIDSNALFDGEGYSQYSPAYMAPSHVMMYTMWFALYAATLSFACLYHGHELKAAFRIMWRSLPWVEKGSSPRSYQDVHNKLMGSYKEVPHWWFLIIFVASIVTGSIGLAVYPTSTSPGVIFYGIFLCLIFVLPTGIITAITGQMVTLNVLAEFIGGLIVEGNALGMNFFKTYGCMTAVMCIVFSGDMKLGHYIKIPPRHTFIVQIAGLTVTTLVMVGVMNFQLHIDGVCTPDAPGKFTCPSEQVLFTASVFWGTLGPRKIWGVGGIYAVTLVGFPIGLVVPLVTYHLQKRYRHLSWLRDLHPVLFFMGAQGLGPWHFGMYFPALPVAWVSWRLVRRKWLGLWSKYNYILSPALACGMAISGIVAFFAFQFYDKNIDWVGNTVNDEAGCSPGDPCSRLKTLDEGEYFGPRMGEF